MIVSTSKHEAMARVVALIEGVQVSLGLSMREDKTERDGQADRRDVSSDALEGEAFRCIGGSTVHP